MYHRPIHIFLTNRWQYSRLKDEVKLVHGREISEQLTMGILCETCGILHPINAVTRKGDWSARKVGLTKPALQERENGRIEWRPMPTIEGKQAGIWINDYVKEAGKFE